MLIFVKRLKGIKIICRGMLEVFNVIVLLSVLGNWKFYNLIEFVCNVFL